MGRLRLRATIARKAFARTLETAADYRPRGQEWTALRHDCAPLGHALRLFGCSDEMNLGVFALERRQQAALRRLYQDICLKCTGILLPDAKRNAPLGPMHTLTAIVGREEEGRKPKSFPLIR